MYYVYLVRNNNNKTYIGYTSSLRRRLGEHSDKYPNLLYYEAYKAEYGARAREQKLKQRGQSIRWLKSRLKHSLV